MTALSVYSGAPAAAGDSTLVAAPGAGLRIVPVFIALQNATTTADTYLLYSGPSSTGTKLLTVLAQNQGDGIVTSTVFNTDPRGRAYKLACGENQALVLNKAQAVAANVTIWYYIADTTA
jgi:hypothetical protein